MRRPPECHFENSRPSPWLWQCWADVSPSWTATVPAPSSAETADLSVRKKTRVGSFWFSIRRLTIFRGTWRLYISKYIYIYYVWKMLKRRFIITELVVQRGWPSINTGAGKRLRKAKKKNMMVQQQCFPSRSFQRLGRANPYLLTKFETYALVTPQKLDGCMWRWPWRWVWRIRVSWRWVWRKGRRWSWRSVKVSVKVSVTTK